MKIAKRTRDEAAWIAAVHASTHKDDDNRGVLADVIDAASSKAVQLYVRAWMATRGAHAVKVGYHSLRETDAEVEALLRTGWNPCT